jgi:seryl-tRNA synthetase
MKTLIKEGFVPVVPPVLIQTSVMRGMGYMEHGGDEDMFIIPKDDLVLVGTAEHSIVPMHKDETLLGKQLPLRYVGFSTAFRREAGSYGKDTRGILRVHQFDKVEMVSYVSEGEDDKEHEFLLSLEEKLFQMLDIPYQVIKMCTGDLGFPTARKYDIEAWIPSQDKYREVTSASTITDFQSRRLNIKYAEGGGPAAGGKKYAQVLNGTAFAIGRTIIAILENYQQEDGSVLIPEVLREYVGKEKLEPREK